MAGFRVLGCVVFVIIVGVGLVNSEEGVAIEEASGEPPPGNPVVFGGVEVCGPIYEAFMFLGPKDEFGKLDPSQIEPWPHLSGLFRAEFPPPADLEIEFAGHGASSVTLGDFKGRTQTIFAIWESSEEVLRDIWADMNAKLLGAKGEPVVERDDYVMWEEGVLRTMISLDAENGGADIWYVCIPTEGEYQAKEESFPVPEGPAEIAEASIKYRASERFLGRPLLSVLAENGEPTVEPIRRNPGILGLFYESYELKGIPCSMWLWLVDGETVYRGFEFAPPFGPSKAVEAFGGFSTMLNQWHGEPLASIGGKDFDRIQNRWLHGSEETILRLEMADDPPWFRFEIIDREKINTIEGDLRPGRKPLPRYVPPPKDSGKTRRDVVVGSARG